MSDMRSSLELLRLGESYPANRVFMLGQFCKRITLRAQQVRALNLAAALKTLLTPRSRIAIIGGGVGGLTCLSGLLEWTEVGKVDLYERSDSLLPLQRHCKTRYLHPFASDWPSAVRMCNDAQLPLLSWRAGFSDEVARQIEKEWILIQSDHLHRYDILCGGQYEVHAIAGEPENRISIVAGSGSIEYDYAVVASGFGAERQLDGPASPLYWENDSLDQQVGQFTRKREQHVLISGTGDGGLIDVLRSVLYDSWHDVLLRMCLDSVPEGTRNRLIALEKDLAKANSEVGGGKKLPSSFVKQFIRDFYSLKAPDLDQQLRLRVRSDRTVLLAGSLEDPCLGTNAFAMNRFLVSRLISISRLSARPFLTYKVGRTEYEPSLNQYILTTSQGKENVYADRVTVRHGPATAEQKTLRDLAQINGVRLDEYETRVAGTELAEEWIGQELPSRVNFGGIPDFQFIHSLYSQWLDHSADAQQLIEEALPLRGHQVADSENATYAFRARVLLFLAERYINIRNAGEAQQCLEQSNSYAKKIDRSICEPFVRQLEIDARWLRAICFKLAGFHEAAIREAQAAREEATLALSKLGNAVSESQYRLQMFRLDRTLVTFFTEAGRLPEASSLAQQFLRGPKYAIGREWASVQPEHIAMTYALPIGMARLLLQFEAFQIIRRVFTFWAETGDISSCRRLLPHFINSFHDVRRVKAMDCTTRLHFLRVLSYCLAVQAIGTEERRSTLELARTGFSAAKMGFVVLGFQKQQKYIERDRIMAKYVQGVTLDEIQRIEYDEFTSQAQSALTIVNTFPPPPQLAVVWRREDEAVPLRIQFVSHVRVLIVVDGHRIVSRPPGFVSIIQQVAEEVVAGLTEYGLNEINLTSLLDVARRAFRYAEVSLGVRTTGLRLCLTAPEPGGLGSVFVRSADVSVFTVSDDGKLKKCRATRIADEIPELFEGRFSSKCRCIITTENIPCLKANSSVIWSVGNRVVSDGVQKINLDQEYEVWDAEYSARLS
jgi:hypothetical protein